MADEKGTGKHPKSSEDPTPHHGKGSESGESKSQHSASSHSQQNEQSRSMQGSSRQGSSQQNQSGAEDLKQREYRDSQGNVHHHTRTSQAMQEDKRKAS